MKLQYKVWSSVKSEMLFYQQCFTNKYAYQLNEWACRLSVYIAIHYLTSTLHTKQFMNSTATLHSWSPSMTSLQATWKLAFT